MAHDSSLGVSFCRARATCGRLKARLGFVSKSIYQYHNIVRFGPCQGVLTVSTVSTPTSHV